MGMEIRWKVRELVGEELFISIYLRGGKGWSPVEEEGGITLCQVDTGVDDSVW